MQHSPVALGWAAGHKSVKDLTTEQIKQEDMKRGVLTGFIVRATLALVCAGLVASSCIREDLSDCPPDPTGPTYNTLLLVTTDFELEERNSRGPADYDWYNNQIQTVTVYAFDSDDNFVTSWTGGAYRMGESYLVPMNFEQDGLYHFVAWTNDGDVYSPSHRAEELQGKTRSELSMSMNVPDGETFMQDIPHRHHGVLESAEIVSDQDNTHTIVISPHTYKTNFIVRGLPTGEGLYDVDVTDSNSQHTFGAELVDGHESYKHLRTLVQKPAPYDDEIAASMILLQIGDGTETMFEIVDTTADEVKYKGDLLKTIKESYSLTDDELAEMLEDIYEYDIIITFTGGGTGGALSAEVTVKAWGYVPNPIDL